LIANSVSDDLLGFISGKKKLRYERLEDVQKEWSWALERLNSL
jgi:hypothetical protein